MKSALVLCLISYVCASLLPKVDFRSPKHIVFSSVGGGRSHNIWMLEVLKELHSRNHTVSFFSRGDHLHFANDYPMINQYNVGGPLDFSMDKVIMKAVLNNPDLMSLNLAVVEASLQNYTKEFYHIQNLSESLNVDMFVCDSFALSCIDASIAMKKPVMMTSTFNVYADLEAPYINKLFYSSPEPTTANEVAWKRFYRDYIRAPLLFLGMRTRLRETVKTQLASGFRLALDSTSPRYNDLSKLVHNVFGIEVAKSLTPLDHHVGPIMRSEYPELDDDTKRFLDNHKRVVYVGFGQHAQATERDIQQILPSLLRLKDEGVIDGIIWARLPLDALEEEDADILLPGWAPQFAILQHPSTLFFISHGGAGSLIESLYSGVRLFVYPFFGDQPMNARALAQNGLGNYFDAFQDEPKEFYERLLSVAIDREGKIQAAINRFRAYVQISSINSAAKTADLVEENLFACDEEGKLGYRRHVKYDISFIKRHDLDIYFIFVAASYLVLLLWKKSQKKDQKRSFKKKHIKQ